MKPILFLFILRASPLTHVAHLTAVPQIWSWSQGSSHLLTCLNGTLDRRKLVREKEEESGREGEGSGRNGTSRPETKAVNGTKDGRRLLLRSEQRLVIPHIVHPINCANKTLTDDQTNGSTITDPSDGHVNGDGGVGDEQRTWNISFTFECKRLTHSPLTLSRSTASMILFFLLHLSLLSHVCVFAVT